MKRENETKKRIRQTALQLFNEKSFEQVTLSEICEKSGVNKHTFYYYFKSKDELLNHYYEIPSDISSGDLSTLLTADSFAEQYWLLAKNMVDFIEKSGVEIFRQIIIKNITQNIGTFNVSEQRNEILKAQIITIEKGQAAGQFLNPAQPRFLALLFHEIAISTAFMWAAQDGAFSYRDTLRYMYENAFLVAPEYRLMNDFELPEMSMCRKPPVHRAAAPGAVPDKPSKGSRTSKK